jgi:hypothetical protein
VGEGAGPTDGRMSPVGPQLDPRLELAHKHRALIASESWPGIHSNSDSIC